MATKFQDSIPKRVVWEAGKLNQPLDYYSWGYNTVLFTFNVPETIDNGKVVFEGYNGYKEPDGTEWGDWFEFGVNSIIDDVKVVSGIDLVQGKYGFVGKLVGFNQVRCRLLEPLKGDGTVEVILACSAAA